MDQIKHTSPSHGYMFWDDLHPTMQMHSWLAIKFKENYHALFKFVPPVAGDHLKIAPNSTLNFFNDRNFIRPSESDEDTEGDASVRSVHSST